MGGVTDGGRWGRAAYVAVTLTLPLGHLPGFKPVAVSDRAARRDLAGARPALVQASGGVRGALHVRSEAFVFNSPRQAGRALAAWRRSRHGRATVAWRDGARIGVIRVSGAGRPVAVRYAALARSWLRSPLPVTAWDRVRAQIRPDGTVSRRTALQAFAAVYGPLPGVRRPPGRRTPVPSGTLAAQWALHYRPQMTRAQQRVVDRVLGVRPLGARAHAASYDDPGFTPSAAVQAIVDKLIPVYEGKLGHTLKQVVVAGTTTTVVTIKKGKNLAYPYADTLSFDAQGDWGQGNEPATCRIRLTPLGQQQKPVYQQLLLAHELFHCFQADLLGIHAWDPIGAWIIEGTADWAALTVDPVAWDVGGGNLEAYIGSPHTPIYQRDYDAVGFWGHAQDTTSDLWLRIEKILDAGSNAKAFALAGGTADAFLNTWGSSVVRFPGGQGGPPWQMSSPIVPPDQAHLLSPLDTITGSGIASAPPGTTAQYGIQPAPGDILVHIGLQGHGRLSSDFNYTDKDLADGWFCTAPGSCFCPQGTTGSVPPTQPLAAKAPLALAGDPGDAVGSFATVTSWPLSHFCQSPAPPTPSHPPAPTGPTGGSNGDPYLTTFDGTGVGFHGAGEYILARSTRDDLEVQARQQPYPRTFTDFHDRLAMNTAFALRVGKATVEVGRGSPLALWIDKRRRRPASGQDIALAGGGTLHYTRGAVVATWPDGTTARVFSIGVEGVNLTMTLSAARAGALQGLLGNDDGTTADDFVGRDGHRYDAAQLHDVGLLSGGTPAARRVLYHRYGPSWRIRQSESLFVYPRGKSTRSYDVPGFPRAQVWPGMLSPAQRAAAARTCTQAGVTDARVRAGCTLDVGATGNHVFATSDAVVQHQGGLGSSAPSAAGIPWAQLSGAPDSSVTLVPSVATTGTSVVAAYARQQANTIESATFAAGPAGVSGVSRTTAVTDPSGVGDPIVFAKPGGGLQMAFTTGNGTEIAPRNDDGSYGTPVLSSSHVYTTISGAALAADGATPLWSTAQAGELAVYRGASDAALNDLGSYSPGAAAEPTLGRDAAGRLWIAWYAGASDPAKAALYMLELDPATGAALGAAMQVPDSADLADNTNPLAMACAQSCRLVYVDSTSGGARLVSWAPGDAAPALVATGSGGAGVSSPAAAFTSDGRLWASWTGREDRLFAKLGDATGAGGSATELPLAAPHTLPLTGTATTAGTTLVLVTNWRNPDGTSSVWATAVPAGS